MRSSVVLVCVAACGGGGGSIDDLSVESLGPGSSNKRQPVVLGGLLHATDIVDGGFHRWDGSAWAQATFPLAGGGTLAPEYAITSVTRTLLVAADGMYPLVDGVAGAKLPGSELALAKRPSHIDAELGAIRADLDRAEHFDETSQAWVPLFPERVGVSQVVERPDGRVVVVFYNYAWVVTPQTVTPEESLIDCTIPALQDCEKAIENLQFLPNGDLLFETDDGVGPEKQRVWQKTGAEVFPVADHNSEFGQERMYVVAWDGLLVATQRTENTSAGTANVIARVPSRERYDQWTLVAPELTRVVQAQTATSLGVVLVNHAPNGGLYLVSR